MGNKVKFSVIVPLYNKEHYIEKTISSILNQSYIDFEIIVVNDGSTDNSVQVVERIQDPRIRLVSKKNEGVSAARNYGILLAQNPYIALIDGDDWWDISFLEKMYVLIQKYPNMVMYGSSYAEVCKHEVLPVFIHDLMPKGQQIIDYIDVFSAHLVPPINTSSVVIRKDILLKKRFDNKISTGEDILLWLQITSEYKVAYMNEVLSFYNRDVLGSITRKLIPINKNFMYYVKSTFTNPSNKLSYLIDALIVRMLRPYYLFDVSPCEVERILSSVDFGKQKYVYYLFYKLPKPIMKAIYKLVKKV